MSKKNHLFRSDSPDFLPGTSFVGEITGYTHRGLGVTRQKGRVVFVPGLLYGEKAEITISGAQKGVLLGAVKKLLRASPHRVAPPCPYFQECGGCALQHMDYRQQLRLKEETVANTLRRVGGFNNLSAALRPIVSMSNPYHYRNKGIFRLYTTPDGDCHLGFLAEHSHTIASGRCTLLFPVAVNELLERLEQHLNRNKAFPVTALRGVLARVSFSDNTLMLILLTNGTLTTAQQQATAALWENLRREEPRLRVFGYTPLERGGPNFRRLTLISSQSVIYERLRGIEYAISPASFFQVNPLQTTAMLDALEAFLPSKSFQLIDAYSGIGTIGLALSRRADRVDCIEIVPEAVADARANCRRNQLTTVRCHLGKAEELFQAVSRDLPTHQEKVVIVDPPRKGCHQQLLRSILDFAPDRLLYVSCNPATLARDLAILSVDYTIDAVQPFDLFPQSYHVETICALSKRNAPNK